ncbi:transcriptional regulator, SarA/Rot family [Corynebacterium sp.]|uniref:MarR family winged helix-turn-helix transcriptional regulator n=1 Tax=Corynebacterium sp. TaxID=1720 RepID=UPI0028AFB54F|nr:MarR family transcriptional regulator [Corynebacterium sp.]
MPEHFQTSSYYWEFLKHARERLNKEHLGPTRMLLALNRSSEVIKNTLEQNVHKKHGLTWPGFKLLFVMWVIGDLEPHRAAELTYLRRATVSSLANSFANRGLVSKRPSDSDGRSVVLSLSPEGQELIDVVLEEQQRWQTSWASPLNSTEQQILTLLLEKLLTGGDGR